ncbi:MAG: hypothetical protein Q9166_000315 [cf. Caloplaca sp. 2 TL-2023]
MSDPEGDVRMQQPSSSEASEDDLNTLFPEANETSNTATLTPRNSNMENLRQFSELSPPTSQDPTDPRSFGNEPMDYGMNGGEGSSPNIMELLGGEASVGPSNRELSIGEREPGASWNNRKQKEEEERVGEQLLDKSFNLREFGDPYNEKDMSDEI